SGVRHKSGAIPQSTADVATPAGRHCVDGLKSPGLRVSLEAIQIRCGDGFGHRMPVLIGELHSTVANDRCNPVPRARMTATAAWETRQDAKQECARTAHRRAILRSAGGRG